MLRCSTVKQHAYQTVHWYTGEVSQPQQRTLPTSRYPLPHWVITPREQFIFIPHARQSFCCGSALCTVRNRSRSLNFSDGRHV